MPADPLTHTDGGTWSGVDFTAVKVLVSHQRRDIGSCICGWGVGTGDLGRLHSLHVWRELQRAVAPLIAARVRAEDLRRMVEEAEATLVKVREHMLIGLQDADLEGDGGTKRINEWADHVDNQIRAAIARAHRTTPQGDDHA